MLLKQVINPVYVVRRLKLALYEAQHPGEPWMAQRAIRVIEDYLRPSDHGFEFGSGRSTLWFARRVKHLVSIEQDAKWVAHVKTELTKANIHNVDYRHINVEEGGTSPQDIDKPYVLAISDEPDDSLDFVVVDGHYRQACILSAKSKLKIGGMLVLDNSNWLSEEAWGIPGNFRRVHRSENVKSETSLYIKT